MLKRTGTARNPLLVAVGLIIGVVMMYVGIRQVMSGFNRMGSGSSLVSRIDSASKTALAEMKTFDDLPSLTFDYPAGWDVSPVDPPFVLQASTLSGTINFSLIRQSMPANGTVTLEEFTASNLEEIKNLDQPGLKFERVHSTENVTVNEIPLIKTLFGTVIHSGDKPVKVRQLMATFIVGEESFILTFSAPDEGYEAAATIFDAILGSIRKK